jgi:hypothetical protein
MKFTTSLKSFLMVVSLSKIYSYLVTKEKDTSNMNSEGVFLFNNI